MTRAEGLDGFLRQWLDPVVLFRDATGDEPLDWQVDYLRWPGDSITLKGRQVGASTCTGVKGIRLARLIPRYRVGIVSPTLALSKEVKDRAKEALERLGEPLVTDSASEVSLRNGSSIKSLPGTPKSVRGWTFDMLVVDEAAFMDPETYLAVSATIATGGLKIVQSTPAGPFGHFHVAWQTRDPSVRRFEVRSDQVPTISAGFLAKERARLTEQEFAQEYLATFGKAGLGLVSPDRLEELTNRAAEARADGEKSVWSRARKP